MNHSSDMPCPPSLPLPLRLLLATGLLVLLPSLNLLACSSSHEMRDSGDADADAGERVDAARDGAAGDGGDGGVEERTWCNGEMCAPGQACCFATGSCFDPAVPGACEATGSSERCGSHTDCGADEYCVRERGGCSGEGTCARVPTLSDCGGEHPVCGCDGVTYPSRCHAGRARVRVSARAGACGEPAEGGGPRPCGGDMSCGAGSTCCLLTGLCTPPDCPDCCSEPPDGTEYPCRTDAHCEDDTFCDGGGCDGLGGCRSSGGSCGGELMPVCGCDGTTYTNACFARRAEVRSAHEGECAAD